MTREWQTEGAMSVNAHPARSTGAPEGPALLARHTLDETAPADYADRIIAMLHGAGAPLPVRE